MEPSKDLKLSVIGSGGWGSRLIRKFQALCGVHLVYGHKNREQLKQDPGVTFTDDIGILIEQSDAIAVAVPPGFNYELAKKILAAGKDLWIEKPMAFSSREATELAALADKSGKVIFVDHILCYGDPVKIFRKAGGIVHAHGVFNRITCDEKTINPQWYLGIHLMAVAVILGIDSDHFTLESSCNATRDERVFTIETDRGEKMTWDILSPDFHQDMLLDGCVHFLDCVRTRKQPLTNGWHGVEVVKAMEKISPNPFQHRE